MTNIHFFTGEDFQQRRALLRGHDDEYFRLDCHEARHPHCSIPRATCSTPNLDQTHRDEAAPNRHWGDGIHPYNSANWPWEASWIADSNDHPRQRNGPVTEEARVLHPHHIRPCRDGESDPLIKDLTRAPASRGPSRLACFLDFVGTNRTGAMPRYIHQQ